MKASACLTAMILLFSSLISPVSAGSTTEPATLSIILTRLHRLQNIDVKFSTVDQWTPPQAFIGLRTGQDRIQNRTDYTDDEFDYLDGNVIFKSAPTDDVLKAALQVRRDVVTETRIITPKRIDQLDIHSNDPRPMGSIRDSREPFNEEDLIDVALGLRVFGKTTYLTPADLQADAIVKLPDGRSAISMNDASEHGYIHCWTMNATNDNLEQYTVSSKGIAFIRIDYEDLREVDHLLLPFKIVMTRRCLLQDAKGNVTGEPIVETATLTVHKYTLNDAGNTPTRYQMIWTKGTSISDERSGESYSVQSGDRTLTDEELAKLPHH